MNSLVLTRYRPYPPIGGAALRNWQNIQALSRLGRVDVVSVGIDDAGGTVPGVVTWTSFPLSRASRLDRARQAAWMSRPGVSPTVDPFNLTAVRAWIHEAASRRRYDVAVIEGIALAAYLPTLKRAVGRVVYDAHNAESALQGHVFEARAAAGAPVTRRLKDLVLQRRLTAAEHRVISGADVVWACSDLDARQIERMFAPRSAVTVVPNAVDVDAYRRPEAPPADGDWRDIPITLVYPGLFAYSPNEDAAIRLVREVLPAVRARGYSARVVLVGRQPTPRLLELAAGDPDVEVTGEVESVLPYLERPCVMTLPMRLGSGTRLKIVEAFAVGRPVVSTSKGAEGLDVVTGEHLLICEDVGSIADAVIRVWTDRTLRRALCQNALTLVRAHYSWDAAGRCIAASLGLACPDAPVQPARTRAAAASLPEPAASVPAS
jgi:glycosyltransferase involved in cell wall biosynthesis